MNGKSINYLLDPEGNINRNPIAIQYPYYLHNPAAGINLLCICFTLTLISYLIRLNIVFIKTSVESIKCYGIFITIIDQALRYHIRLYHTELNRIS